MLQHFHRPQTIEEAVALKKEWGNKSLYLAGGTHVGSSTFPEVPEHAISLEGLGLDKIEEDDTHWSIGAMMTLQSLIDSSLTPTPLKKAAKNVTNRNIRNIATIGGALGSNREAGDLLPCLLALQADVEIVDTTQAHHTIKVADYLADDKEDLIVRVLIPKSAQERYIGLAKYSRTANDLSLVATAMSFQKDGELFKDVVVAVGGTTLHVHLEPELAAFFEGRTLPSKDEILAFVKEKLNAISNFHANGDFRIHLAGAQLADIAHSIYPSATKGW